MKRKKLFLSTLVPLTVLTTVPFVVSCNTTKKAEPNPSTENPDTPTAPSTNPSNPGSSTNITPPASSGGSSSTVSTGSSDKYNSVTNPGYVTNSENKPLINEYLYHENKYLNALTKYIKEEGLSETNLAEVNALYNKLSPNIENYNTKAKLGYQPLFDDAFYKNFSVPDTDNNLILNPLKTAFKKPNLDTRDPGNRGTQDLLPNQKYKDIALQSYVIRFNNTNKLLEQWLDANPTAKKDFVAGSAPFGTAWILDYEPTTKDSYPTKWYLATNVHVALELIKPALNGDIYTNTPNEEEEKKIIVEAYLKREEVAKKFEPYLAKQKPIVERLGEARAKEDPEYKAIEAEIEKLGLGQEYFKANINFKNALTKLKGQTTSVQIQLLNKETPVYDPSNPDISQIKYIDWANKNVLSLSLDTAQVKIVYAGVDFLNHKTNFLAENSPYKNNDIMADFAVLEIDFSKQRSNSEGSYDFQRGIDPTDLNNNQRIHGKINTVQNLAKLFTSDYANWEAKRKAKPANFDLYSDYYKIQNEKVTFDYNGRPTETSKANLNYFALGFPNAKTDYKIPDDSLSDAEKAQLGYKAALWVNKPRQFLGKNPIMDLGSKLTEHVALQTNVNKPGVIDITIAAPIIGDKGYFIGNLSEKNHPYSSKNVINYGLGYVLASWQPLGGASGSSMRDIDNNLLGLTYASADNQGISLQSIAQALRSPGINYNGLYGKYNLEQYDLIYGGGRNQRTSYRQKLMELYGGHYRTHLFPNGLNEIPEEYKFKN